MKHPSPATRQLQAFLKCSLMNEFLDIRRCRIALKRDLSQALIKNHTRKKAASKGGSW